MNFMELFFIAVGLSMDAFAVSICKGLSLQKMQWKHTVLAGCYFGGFQALMPAFGYLLGVQFERFIINIDHWIAFILLLLIGGKMLQESQGEAESLDAGFSVQTMLILAIATSIDALAMGITFAFLKVNIGLAISMIGITTFIFSAIGIKIGYDFGARYKARAEMAGGFILIIIGFKILLGHLGIL